MHRLGSSFFLSLTFHTLIALSIWALYDRTQAPKPSAEHSFYISLSNYVPSLPAPAKKQCATVKRTTPVVSKKDIKPEPIPEDEVVKSVPVTQVEPEVIKPAAVVKAPDTIEQEAQEAVPLPEAIESTQDETSDNTRERTGKDLSKQSSAPQIDEAYLQEHMALIARLLQENLYYPRSARKRGITGEVVVAFRLKQNGEASAIEVRSGAKAMLNRAAITTIERLSGEFPRPQQPLVLQVPIQYRLR